MTSYALTSDPNLILRDDGAWIPADPDNVDYQAFLEWRKVGNQPTPYPGQVAPASTPSPASSPPAAPAAPAPVLQGI